jgi:hypothetical protein
MPLSHALSPVPRRDLPQRPRPCGTRTALRMPWARRRIALVSMPGKTIFSARIHANPEDRT